MTRPSCPMCRCWIRHRRANQCQPCWLSLWTSQEVREWDDPEMREARRQWERELDARGHQVTHRSCNSTENTAATSMHGVQAARITGWSSLTTDEWRLMRWMQMFGGNPLTR